MPSKPTPALNIYLNNYNNHYRSNVVAIGGHADGVRPLVRRSCVRMEIVCAAWRVCCWPRGGEIEAEARYRRRAGIARPRPHEADCQYQRPSALLRKGECASEGGRAEIYLNCDDEEMLE